MNLQERLFRVISLGMLGLGFVAGVAVADRDGADQTVKDLESLVHEIKAAEEVEAINTKGLPTGSHAVTDLPEKKPIAKD